MENTFKILEKIQNTSSRNEKEDILKTYQNNELLKKTLEYTYNPFKVYGIGKKAFKITKDASNNFNTIFELLNYLLEHSTGTDVDKSKVNDFISSQPIYTQEWYKKMVLKDFKIGVTAKTINKIFGKGFIPIFEVELAKPFERFFKNVACEVKIDGVRNIAIKQNGNVTMFTRNGKLVKGFNSVMNDIKNLPIDNIVFDGELIGKDYTDTMNKLFAKSKNKEATYMIFDMLSPEEFYQGVSSNDYWTRKQGIININKNLNHQKYLNLKFVEPLAILNNPTINQFNELMNKVVNDGFEGIMIKPLNSKYECKRNYNWQKLKPFMSDEFKIIGFEEGDGKYKNTLGKIIIDVNGTEVGVGSGFSDKQRKNIWNNQKSYVGKEIEVQYQELIKKTGSLRFPTVKSIRLDK